MSDAEVLLLMTEVAVTFAGFASLVGIFGQRAAADDPVVLGVRMRAMLTSSLLVAGFALLPVVLTQLDVDTNVVWTAAAWILLAGTVGYVLWVAAVLRQGLRARVRPHRIQRVIILPVVLLSIVGMIVLALVNAWVRSPGLYLSVLYVMLLHAGFGFALIVYSFLPRLPGGE